MISECSTTNDHISYCPLRRIVVFYLTITVRLYFPVFPVANVSNIIKFPTKYWIRGMLRRTHLDHFESASLFRCCTANKYFSVLFISSSPNINFRGLSISSPSKPEHLTLPYSLTVLPIDIFLLLLLVVILAGTAKFNSTLFFHHELF